MGGIILLIIGALVFVRMRAKKVEATELGIDYMPELPEEPFAFEFPPPEIPTMEMPEMPAEIRAEIEARAVEMRIPELVAVERPVQLVPRAAVVTPTRPEKAMPTGYIRPVRDTLSAPADAPEGGQWLMSADRQTMVYAYNPLAGTPEFRLDLTEHYLVDGTQLTTEEARAILSGRAVRGYAGRDIPVAQPRGPVRTQ